MIRTFSAAAHIAGIAAWNKITRIAGDQRKVVLGQEMLNRRISCSGNGIHVTIGTNGQLVLLFKIVVKAAAAKGHSYNFLPNPIQAPVKFIKVVFKEFRYGLRVVNPGYIVVTLIYRAVLCCIMIPFLFDRCIA